VAITISVLSFAIFRDSTKRIVPDQAYLQWFRLLVLLFSLLGCFRGYCGRDLLRLGTGTGWPDLVIAAIMATLALQGAWTVLRQAFGELRLASPQPAE
jgi:hypothetical protein